MHAPCACRRIHKHMHINQTYHFCYSSECIALFFVFCLAFMFQDLLDWIRLSLVFVSYSVLCVMMMTSHPLPHREIYTYTGARETPEVYHTAPQRLRVHFRQSHIQAQRSVLTLCVLLVRFYGRILSIIVGEDGSVRGGNAGNWMSGTCQHGLGSIQLTGVVITLGLGKTTGRKHSHLNFLGFRQAYNSISYILLRGPDLQDLKVS